MKDKIRGIEGDQSTVVHEPINGPRMDPTALNTVAGNMDDEADGERRQQADRNVPKPGAKCAYSLEVNPRR